MVSIRLIKHIKPDFAQKYIRRFGFEPARNPAYFTLALGAGAVTPLQLAVGYSMIANGGYYVKPFFIDRIVDNDGKLIRKYEPLKIGDEKFRVIDAKHAFILNNILSEVIKNGTGRKARVLRRPDIAGKTGTTNNAVDAWFAGYQPTLTAITWFGFDSPKSLGKNQTGSAVALPFWIDFMKDALKDVPVSFVPEPYGIIRINNNLYTNETMPPNGVRSIDVKTLDDEIDTS
jgi:penicillin-binding protein 1A